MIRRILIATAISSILFALGCSSISGAIFSSPIVNLGAVAQAGPDSEQPLKPGDGKASVANDVAALPVTPDLVIQDITWLPSHPSLKNIITFTVTIRNQGSGKAGFSRVGFYVDDVYRTTTGVGSLDPGVTVTKTFFWKAQAGSHTIRVVADATDEVNEANETNNMKTVAFTTATPDLVVQTITWSPEEPSKGDTVNFDVILKNQSIIQSDPSVVYFYMDDLFKGSKEVPALAAGATANQTFTWTALEGSHVFEAVADGEGYITEKDETNNEKEVTVTTILPDLAVQSITWAPEYPAESENVTFTVSVQNQGAGKAGNSYLAFYVDNTLLTSSRVSSIDSGATADMTFTWLALEGSHIIRMVADSRNQLAEGDENNNERTASFSSYIPDLIIQNISWSPASPSIGDTVTFTVTINNQAGSRAGVSRVSFYMNGILMDTEDVPAIPAATSVTETFTWTARAGPYTLKAIADAEFQIPESDERNNWKRVIFPGTAAPDLIVEAITWSPASPSIGDKVTFTATIKNQGSGKADDSYVDFYVDDAYSRSTHIDQLNAGASANKTFSWNAAAGSHVLKVVTDTNTRNIESDETNNVKEVTVSTLAPDLVVEDIVWSPESPSIGNEVTCTATIGNQGSDKAGYSYLGYYIDNAFMGDLEVPEIAAGANVTVTFPWIIPEGSHSIRAVIDTEDDVPESDEDNNGKTVIFLAPDLIVQDITWLPENPSVGDSVTLTVAVRNDGSRRTGSFPVHIYINGFLVGRPEIHGLGAGATATGEFVWVADETEGIQAVKAVAGFQNKIAESDETSNEKLVVLRLFPPTASAPQPVTTPSPDTVPVPEPNKENEYLSVQGSQVTAGPEETATRKPLPATPSWDGIWEGGWPVTAGVILLGAMSVALLFLVALLLLRQRRF